MIKHLSVAASVLALTCTAAIAGGVAAPEASAPALIPAPAPMAAGAFYGALSFGGMNLDASITQDIDPANDYYQGSIDTDTGTGILAALGYDFGNGFRVELELSRLQGDTGDLSFPDAQAPYDVAVTDGDYRLTSGMVNGWYTFGTGSVRPFVGAGLGVMEASIDTAFTLGSNNGITDKDSAFAYMLGAGVEIPMSDTMSIVASYRYLAADGFEMTDNEGTDIEADFSGHVVTIGALVRF